MRRRPLEGRSPEDRPPPSGPVVRAMALVLLLLLGAALVKTSAYRPWDFETYWLAAKAAAQGLDPYDTSALASLAGRPVGMPFVYPPVTLLFFAPFSLLPLGQASAAWLVLKVVLLAALLGVWGRAFLARTHWLALAAAGVLGFNAAAIWDLKSGNVAIVEQTLLWCGFAAYARDRRVLFAALVGAAAIFKLMPIAFLGLLLVPSRGRGVDWRLAVGTATVFALAVFLPAGLGPAWARHYLTNVPAERPWGDANPSALGLIDTLVGDHAAPLLAAPFRSLIPWGVYLLAVGAAGIPLARAAWRERVPERTVLVAALAYALVAPRFMAYSYLLAIPPALALLPPLLARYGGQWTVTAALCAQAALARLLGLKYRTPWTANIPFFLLLASWLWITRAAGRNSVPRSRGEAGRGVRRERSPRPARAPRTSGGAGAS